MRHLLTLVIASLFLVPAVAGQEMQTVSGRVVDQHGEPVVGADVYLYQYGYSEPRPIEEGEGKTSAPASEPAQEQYHQAHAVTDSQGYYVLQARNGWAELNVQKEGYAYAYHGVEISGATSHDFTVAKYPDRSASISGQVNVPNVSISIEYPEFGLYECSMHDGDQQTVQGNSSDGSMEAASDTMIARPYYNGCQITVYDDGSFNGQVYPGYAILRAYHDMWRECPSGDCQGYYGHVQVMQLQEGANNVDISLKARPAPDAEIKGYVLDADGLPVQGVYLSFSHQDSYSYGQGKTDADGSFRVAVRSGLVEVSVWADGYFPWHGMVEASKGGDLLIIRLTEGTSQYGGYCCYAYAEDSDMKAMAGAPGQAAASLDGAGSENAASSPDGIQDLGGGLGPYQAETTHADTPGLPLMALLGAIAVALLARRK